MPEIHFLYLLDGAKAFIYGGAIRDSLAGVPINDIDIVCTPKSKKKLVKKLNKNSDGIYLFENDYCEDEKDSKKKLLKGIESIK